MGQDSFIHETSEANINRPKGENLTIFRKEGVARVAADPAAPYQVMHPDGYIEPLGGGGGGGITPFIIGDIDASTEPDYPAASAGEAYRIIVSGKIGGAAGIIVEQGDQDQEDGDIIYALEDNPGGDQATVGTSWTIWEGEEIRLFERGVGVNSIEQRYSGSTANGVNAIAVGLNTSADGANSHAEGQTTLASGAQSHAEGFSTTASGDNSHAEGLTTTASAAQSHAEGLNTQATNDNAHAEGFGTLASGAQSHAEGLSGVSSGPSSHAEGRQSTASGEASHAEGRSTVASNDNAHSEGLFTIASGDQAHAEGERTSATGANSHSGGLGVVGFLVIASGPNAFNHSEAIDVASNASGRGSAILGGYQSNTPGEFSSVIGGQSHTANGLNSHIAGGMSHTTDINSDNSACVGGTSNTIGPSGTRSVIIGGTGRTENVIDYVNVPNLRVSTTPNYADNATALANGLTLGAVYRTGDDLKVVH